MKWKNNIVIFAVYLVGFINGLPLEETPNKLVDIAENCNSVCSKGHDKEITDLNKSLCECSGTNIDSTALNNDSKLVYGKLETKAQHEGGKKFKRYTIKETLDKINTIKKTPIKTVKPLTRFKPDRLTQKSDFKTKSSGLFNHGKEVPRLKELGERIKSLRTRLSPNPRFQSRAAFSEDHTTKDLVKQLKDKREEQLKTLRSKSNIGKESGTLKEKVGSSYLHNLIDTVGSNLKSKLINNKIKPKEIKTKEIVGSVNKQSTTTVIPRTTSAIPEIVLGQTEASASKSTAGVQKEIKGTAEVIEGSNTKTETALTLEKIKEKQKETVTKIKDKLSAVKNKSKNLEVVIDSKPT